MEEDIVSKTHSMNEFLEKDDLKGFVKFCFEVEGFEVFKSYFKNKIITEWPNFVNDLFHELIQENFDLFESK